jgi:hypothetical protein
MHHDNDEMKEQKAPEKNTDNAFVQVGEDGSPVMPSVDKEQLEGDIKQQNDEAENATTAGTP